MSDSPTAPGSQRDGPQRSIDYPYLLSKVAFYALLALLALWLLAQVKEIVFTLFLSLLIAYVLDPLVDWFEARRVPRGISILLLLMGLITAAAGFSFWVIPPLAEETRELGAKLRGWLSQDHTALIAWVEDKLGMELAGAFAAVKLKMQDAAPEILGHVGTFIEGAALKTVNAISSVLSVALVPLFVFYFLRDFDRMSAWASDQLPLRHRDSILARVKQTNQVIGEWLRGQVEVALIMAVLYSVSLGLLGLKLGVAIGILAGLLNVVPYLGFAFGLSLALIMSVLDWSGGFTVLGVAGVFAAVSILEGYFLTPRLVGEKVGLSPVVVLIALLIGGEAFGLFGIIIAVPTAGVIKTLAVDGMEWYRTSEAFLGNGETT